MMTKRLYYLSIILLFFACKTSQKTTSTLLEDDGKIEVVFLQINDVYEIEALEGGKVGGMARFAALRKRLINENANTLTVHAGDFLNPSLIGTLKHEGEKIKGKQMVEVMNKCKVDLCVFGNHEFDLKEAELQKRLNESTFDWLGTNVLHKVGNKELPFHKMVEDQKQDIERTFTWNVVDEDGTELKIGIFGATINSNPKDYVVYKDHTVEALEACQELALETDVIIGLTHLDIETDLKLAKLLPQVPLIMGGHDHHHMKHQVGNTIVAKADANAKSAYVHTLYFNKKTRMARVSSRLISIDDSIQDDLEVAATVRKWSAILKNNIRNIYPYPNKVIYTTKVPLDGRESTNRLKQTNLGDIFTKAMSQAALQEVDCSFMNSGSVRIDDQLSGDITAIDIFRTLPYGGKIVEVDLTGKVLLEVLDEGRSKKGNGAFLQLHKVRYSAKNQRWEIKGEAIDPEKTYHAMATDYLMLGLDIKSLKTDLPGVLKVDEPKEGDENDLRRDIRLVIIDYLKTLESK